MKERIQRILFAYELIEAMKADHNARYDQGKEVGKFRYKSTQEDLFRRHPAVGTEQLFTTIRSYKRKIDGGEEFMGNVSDEKFRALTKYIFEDMGDKEWPEVRKHYAEFAGGSFSLLLADASPDVVSNRTIEALGYDASEPKGLHMLRLAYQQIGKDLENQRIASMKTREQVQLLRKEKEAVLREVSDIIRTLQRKGKARTGNEQKQLDRLLALKK